MNKTLAQELLTVKYQSKRFNVCFVEQLDQPLVVDVLPFSHSLLQSRSEHTAPVALPRYFGITVSWPAPAGHHLRPSYSRHYKVFLAVLLVDNLRGVAGEVAHCKEYKVWRWQWTGQPPEIWGQLQTELYFYYCCSCGQQPTRPLRLFSKGINRH